jgi:ketosteroid isomerase-like protein
MKLKMAIALAAILVAASVCSSARADDRKDIEALYGKLEHAFMKKDVAAVENLQTPDFTHKGADGKVTSGKEVDAQMRQQFAMQETAKMNIKVVKCVIKGKTAKADTTFTYIATMKDKDGQMGPKGKIHTLTMAGGVGNDLVKTAQGWKFKSMEQHVGKMTMDGKPMDPNAMGGPPKKK